MKWEMEVDQMEPVLEKIWDLHDKLSDAIHSISRTHFLNSVRSHHTRKASEETFVPKKKPSDFPVGDGADKNNKTGFVYFKDLPGCPDADAIEEAKSLNAIRSALENLEDQLEFFHNVQAHQQAERDAAISRIEQSRIVLAMRLAEHQGKKYEVIKEAEAFVGEVCEATHFISPAGSTSGEKFVAQAGKRRNAIVDAFLSSLHYVKKSLKLDCMGGVLGNAAMVAISMFALMHLQQVGIRDRYIMEFPQNHDVKRKLSRVSQLEDSSSGGRSPPLDVMLARG